MHGGSRVPPEPRAPQLVLREGERFGLLHLDLAGRRVAEGNVVPDGAWNDVPLDEHAYALHERTLDHAGRVQALGHLHMPALDGGHGQTIAFLLGEPTCAPGLPCLDSGLVPFPRSF